MEREGRRGREGGRGEGGRGGGGEGRREGGGGGRETKKEIENLLRACTPSHSSLHLLPLLYIFPLFPSLTIWFPSCSSGEEYLPSLVEWQ